MNDEGVLHTVLYDGRFKHWRICNLSTGTIYSSEFQSQEEALVAARKGGDNESGNDRVYSRYSIVREMSDLTGLEFVNVEG